MSIGGNGAVHVSAYPSRGDTMGIQRTLFLSRSPPEAKIGTRPSCMNQNICLAGPSYWIERFPGNSIKRQGPTSNLIIFTCRAGTVARRIKTELQYGLSSQNLKLFPTSR